jgi:CheY-like chemotaxis protein
MAPKTKNKVLIVDDSYTNVVLLDAILHKEGFETDSAISGKEALDLITGDQKPALILLDLHMPQVSGLEFLKRLRANKGNADIPVIVVSADDAAKRMNATMAAGANDYIQKPVDIQGLLEKVNHYLTA